MSKPFNYDGFFYLNDGTNRVGINSSIPSETLDIVGNTKISGILTASTYSGPIVNSSGISTFYDLRVSNNLTVEGTTTTLDTNLIGVDRIEVGANSNTVVGVAITQSGTADILNLYDGSTEIFSVEDGGDIISKGQYFKIENAASPEIQLTDTSASNSLCFIRNSSGNLRFAADNNNVHSDTSLMFLVDGSEAMRIKGSNVGIGTAAPLQKLHVTDDTSANIYIETKNGTTGSTAGIYYKTSSSTASGFFKTGIVLEDDDTSHARGKLHILQNNTADGSNASLSDSVVTFAQDGKVGIGTDDPQVKLHVTEDAPGTSSLPTFNASTRFVVSDTENPSSYNAIAVLGGHNGAAFVKFGDKNNEKAGQIGYYNSDDSMRFYTSGSATEKLRIASDGDLTLTGADNVEIKMKCGTSSGNNILAFQNSSGVTRGNITYDSDNNFLLFNVNQDEKLRIASNGRVGIGTNNPLAPVDILTTPIESSTINTTNCLQLGLWVRAKSPSNTTGNIYTGVTLGEGRAGLYSYDDGGGAAHGMGFWTGSNSGVSERLRITSSGNVGIGTDNPKVSGLHVDGVIFAGTPFISSGLQYGGVRLESNHSGSQSGGIIYGGAHGDVNHSIFFRRGYDGTLDTLDINEYGMFRIFTGGALASQTERLRISSDKMRLSGISSVSIGFNADAQRRVDIVTGDDNGVLIRPTTASEGSEGSADSIQDLIQLRNPWGSSAHNTGNAGARFGIQMRAYNGAGDFNTKDPAKSAAIYAVSEDEFSGYWKNVGLAFYTSAYNQSQAEKVRIDTNGKVGIGTDSPVGKLHIWSTGPDIILTDHNQAADNRNWLLTGANTQILRIQAQNDSYAGGGNLFDFYRSGNQLNEFRGMNGGNYWFTINNDTKKVGIGTVNPDTPLHIYANDAQQITVERSNSLNSGIRFKNTTSSMFAGLTQNATGFAIDDDDDLSSGPMFFVERSTGNIGVNCTPTAAPLEVKQQSDDSGVLRLRDSTDQYRYLEFDVTNALTQITARSNNSHGNIDIGTLSQFGRRSCLHIDSSGLVGINTNDPEKQLHVYHTSTNYIAKFESADSTVQIGFFDSSTTNGTYIGAQSENLILYTNGFNERLYVDSNGNIGISAVPVTSGTLYDTVDHFLVIGDSDTGIAQDGDGQLEIWANNQEVANFTNGQATFEKQVVVPRMGIGVAPTSAGDFGGNSARLAIGDSDTGFGQISDGFLATYTNGVERLRITNVGRIWIGNPNGRSPASTTAHIQLEGVDASTSAMAITRNSANSGGPQIIFNKTRGTGIGSDTVVNNGDTLGILHFVGSDGNDSDNTAAMIVAKVDGSISSNDVPGRLQFETKTDGGSFTEKLRIHNDAKVSCYGLLQIPNAGTGIKFGPGDSVNDDAHIEWLGSNNAGYLRISISDDSDSSGTNEYIEFGDYSNQNRGGTFTRHVRISRDQFLVRTGSNTITQADRFRVNSEGHVFMPSLNSGSSSDDVQYGSNGQLIVNASTRLVKTDIEDCSYGLAEINQLKPRIYKRTDADNKVEIGFIADEVQSILPEIVSTKEKSFFTKNESDTEIIPSNVDLKRLTVILTKAIQEQQEQIETLKSKVAALEGS
jgi:hypothetical protein